MNLYYAGINELELQVIRVEIWKFEFLRIVQFFLLLVYIVLVELLYLVFIGVEMFMEFIV